MSYNEGLFKTQDAIALTASIAYDVGLDYNKVIKNPSILAEKIGYQVGGKLLQPIVKDFTPKFLKDEEDFLYFTSNQIHFTTGLICLIHNYWGKNNNWKQSAKQGVIEGVSSYLGDQIRRKLSKNKDFKLQDEIII